MQAPHLMHLLLSILKGCLILPEMAPTGHRREHLEQPLHSSSMI